MLRVIVFDCDGVMFDSRQANLAFYNQLLAHFGLPPMPPEEEDFVHMHSVGESLRQIFRHYRQPSLAEVEEVRRQHDYTPYLSLMTMEPDLVEFLQQTRQRYHLAISTNRTDSIFPLLRHYGLETYFGKIMTAANATRPKPAPDALLEILAHYRCHSSEALYIGDSTVDVAHAAACGVPLIAFKNPDLPAAYHVRSFREILALPPLRLG
jgi:phosphoglycolate phosphatase